jgi:hypothetical protein
MVPHKNAPLTLKGREAMVRSLLKEGSAARQFNVVPKIVAKWVVSAQKVRMDCGICPRPHSLTSQTPAAVCAVVEALRRQRYTGKQIVAKVRTPPATGSRIPHRLGLNGLATLEPV